MRVSRSRRHVRKVSSARDHIAGYARARPLLQRWRRAFGAIEAPSDRGVISVVAICPTGKSFEVLAAQIEGLRQQTHPSWELMLVVLGDDMPGLAELQSLVGGDKRIRLVPSAAGIGQAIGLNTAAGLATGGHLLFLDARTVLAPTALGWFAVCANSADLIYSDEGLRSRKGVYQGQYFKVGWSPRMLLSLDYLESAICVDASMFRAMGGFRDGPTPFRDLALRLSEHPIRVAHLPVPLMDRWGRAPRRLADTAVPVIQAVERRDWNARVTIDGETSRTRVEFDVSPSNLVAKVVIPTRDRVDLLKKAVSGVLEMTSGIAVHVVVVDNGSRETTTGRYLDLLRERGDVTVIRRDEPFNFSRLVNRGAESGPNADLLLFLNNDTEITHRDWLLQLSGWLRDPAVVGVGPKLLYPDGRIQHAGLVIGMDLVGHYARGLQKLPRSGPPDVAREVSVLTGACLLVRTADFEAIGGFDEQLPIDFQDVDLCLRLRQLGGDLIYDPTYPLLHHESASRDLAEAGSEETLSRIRARQGSVLEVPDPFWNPHISLLPPGGGLAPIPVESARRERVQPRIRTCRPTDPTAGPAFR